MTDFLIYDLKVAALIAVFYMFYRLLLSRETFHRLNRIVLLSTAVASFVLPLCIITLHKTVLMTMPEVTDTMETVMVEVAEEPTPWWQIALPVVFFAGMAVTVGHTLTSVAKVILLIRRSEKHPQEDGTVVCVTGRADMPPFSWMHYIVMNRSDYEQQDAAILAHERAHIRLGHSWDVLLADLLTALQWFNPAMWMLRADLRAIHEYEADRAVLSQGIDAHQYQYLLITKAAGIGGYSIANGISHSTLKNRINMMLHKQSKPKNYLKLLALLPVVGIVLAANARSVTDITYVNADNSSKAIDEQAVAATPAATPQTDDKEKKKKVIVDLNSETHPLVIVNGTEMPYDNFVSISPNIIKSITVLKNKEALTKYGEKGKDGVILVEIEDHPNQKGHEPFLLKGLVIDEKKEPVVGAIVRVKGTKQGTVTDLDGRYTIEVPDGATIEVAYVGMETATFTTSKAIAESRTTAIVLKKDGSNEPVKYEATLTYNGTDNDKSYDVVDQMPEFPGGVGARMQYLAKNVKYPVEAQRKGQQGNVVVKFTVEKDGSITNSRVVRSISPLLDAEALRVINAMPKWIPGRHHGKAVSVGYVLPVSFVLQKANGKTEIAAAIDKGDDVTFVLDGVTVVGYELLDLIDPDKVESMYIDKSEKSKPVIKINTKKKK